MHASPARKLLPRPTRVRRIRAVRLRWSIDLVGLRIGRDRVVGVVDSLPADQIETERDVLTAGEADALVELGHAEPVHTATIIRFPEPW